MTEQKFASSRRSVLLAALAFGAICGMGSIAPGLAESSGHMSEGHTSKNHTKGQSAWSGQTNSKVRLVSGTVEREGDRELYAGVQLRMDDGWKTYWRNPGDSGVPPVFDWSGSKNVKKVEVFYPAPHRFADAGGTAIGYDGEVLFPVRVTPEQAGEPVMLSLNFDYGLCKDLCIPNSVALEAVLPPDLGKGDTPLLEAALSRVPAQPRDDILPRITSISATLDGEAPGLEIEAEFPVGAEGADIFVHNPQLLVPVPKALGPLADGKQRFVVAFLVPDEAAAIKDKPLTVTLVSDKGATETTWTAD